MMTKIIEFLTGNDGKTEIKSSLHHYTSYVVYVYMVSK